MEYQFYQVDVFTSKPLGGNPLAVFIDAQGLDASTMQSIAREMNLSETTFVFPSKITDVDAEVRIYTPSKELPFAGHPTLGTAHVLREVGCIPQNQSVTRLQMSAGIIPVSAETGTNLLFMQQPSPQFLEICGLKKQIADALSLSPSLIDDRWPAQVVTTGFPALYVPLTTLDAVRSVDLHLGSLRNLLSAFHVDMIYVFTQETLRTESTVHVRAYAPFIGISEDPATGSAAGGMAAYFTHYVLETPGPQESILIEQGYEMGRPATIRAYVCQEKDKGISVKVGGESRTVIEGRLNL